MFLMEAERMLLVMKFSQTRWFVFSPFLNVLEETDFEGSVRMLLQHGIDCREIEEAYGQMERTGDSVAEFGLNRTLVLTRQADPDADRWFGLAA
jgi:hypothetical protein